MSDTLYREPAPQPPDPYLVAWADLRRRQLAAAPAIGAVVVLPAVVVACVYSAGLIGLLSLLPVMIGWAAVGAVGGLHGGLAGGGCAVGSARWR